MGLDITAVSKAMRVGDLPTNDKQVDDAYSKGWDIIDASTDFRTQFDDLKPGVYAFNGKKFSFRAGSYSGYNQFRNDLSRFALGLTPHEVWNRSTTFMAAGVPFVEMISFSDCEGTIGPKTSAKLANDFKVHEKAVLKAAREYFKHNREEYEYFRYRYREWKKAFKLAADGGYVDFH